jgi:general stress protein CsbA
MPHVARLVLIAFAGISLLAALWTGLARLGWPLPLPNPDFHSLHGPLMVVGFLGTLIGLERAVAVERFWVYGIPLFSALSYLSLLSGVPRQTVASLALVAAALFALLFASLYRRQPSEHFVVMTLSAVSLCAGNLIWMTEAPLSEVVPWWVGFLVLMIAGERLELARIRRPPAHVRVKFGLSVAIVLLGLLVSAFAFFTGVRIAGAGMIALAFWLLRYDLAWQSLRQPGLPRFMASCLIAGYVWLAVGGTLWLPLAGSFVAGPLYDAMLHSIFLGFVFSMIFAHGPIMLPVITGVKMAFLKTFYFHAILLHLSLVLRIFGDLADINAAQKWGGALNALAILLFLVNNVRAVRQEARV